MAFEGRTWRCQQRRRHLLSAGHHFLQLLAKQSKSGLDEHELGWCGYGVSCVVQRGLLPRLRKEVVHWSHRRSGPARSLMSYSYDAEILEF